MKKENSRAIIVTSIMGAIGFILMMLEFPISFLIPSFVKFDFSELPALITSFAFGPVYGVLVCLIKNLLHLFVTTSAGVGELSNFILGAIFTGIAGIVYKRKPSRKTAFLGTLLGAIIMSLISIPSNYFIVYPAYTVIYGLPMPAILGMYKAILPFADTLLKALVIFNFPFNIAKGLIDTAICFLIYKKLSPILKHGINKNKC